MLASGKVTLHTRTYPLTSAVEAFADLDAGRVRGRAISSLITAMTENMSYKD